MVTLRRVHAVLFCLAASSLNLRRSSAWVSLQKNHPFCVRCYHHQLHQTRISASSKPTGVGKSSLSLRELFPPASSIGNGTLKTEDSAHQLFYQIYGTGPLRALFLHGGPGAGCFPNHARFFDLAKYQVVLLDQRGCGQSTPSGCLVNQTLDHVVDDCDLLRQHLEWDQWDLILGGSWGTTVAMAYAQRYPQSMRSVILRGVCTMRQQEIDWVFANRPNRSDNPAWRTFCEAVDVDPDNVEYPRQALHAYYVRFVLSSNDTKRQSAARAWMSWEFYNGMAHQLPPGTNLTDRNATMDALSTWKVRRPSTSPVLVSSKGQWEYQSADAMPMVKVPPNLPQDGLEIKKRLRQGIQNDDPAAPARDPWSFPDIPVSASQDSRLPVQPLLTCFYSTNDDACRNYRNLLSESLPFPKNVPCIAIQGGADGICPPDTALDVLGRWPSMELRIPVYAGHSMYDPYIAHELVQATDRMATQLMEA